MKRKLTLGLLISLFTSALMAQSPTFSEGDKVLNLGIGFGSILYSGSYNTSSVPPISASFEVGVKDNVLDVGTIAVGGYVGYVAYKYEYLSWGYKYSNIVIGARGILHYPLMDKLDTYAGILLGFNIVSAKEFGDIGFGYSYNASGSRLIAGAFAGGRYYFTDNIAGFLEFGYSFAIVNLGISFKM